MYFTLLTFEIIELRAARTQYIFALLKRFSCKSKILLFYIVLINTFLVFCVLKGMWSKKELAPWCERFVQALQYFANTISILKTITLFAKDSLKVLQYG